MTRDYARLMTGPTVAVPRWVLLGLAALAMLYIAFRIYHEPSWTLQRLDAPDGSRIALLQRTVYVHDHLRVRIKDGRLWFDAYYSPPFTNNFRVDLGERLAWSEGGQRLDLRIGGRVVWSYDFTRERAVDADPSDAW